MFYPDKKKHISPSALAAWHESRGLFVRSYFIGEKSPETPAMKAGKKIHALIEGNMLEVKYRFEHPESILCYALVGEEWVKVEVKEDGTYDLPEGAQFAIYGIPDSWGLSADTAVFVDYKSGKENTWDNDRLSTDLKMKLTALLVWLAAGRPAHVRGHLEYIPTQWNPVAKEIEPTFEPSVDAGQVLYTAAELEEFLVFVLKTVSEVNEAYGEWLTSTDEFINQDDVAEYAQLKQEVVQRETRMEILLERLADQMKLGKKETLATVFGSFFFKTSKKFDPVPPTLEVKVEDGGSFATVEYGYAEKIAVAMSAAKKKFEQSREPIEVSQSLQFRAKKV